MPPRTIILAIVVFWLAMTAWLLRREVWPRIAPGSPPAFAVALLDGSRAAETRVHWTVSRRRVGSEAPDSSEARPSQLLTWVTTGQDDTLTLHAAPPESKQPPPASGLRLFAPAVFSSSYRVTRDGRMLGFKAEVTLASGLPLPLGTHMGTFEGEVRDGVCTINWEMGSQSTQSTRTRGSEQVEVSPNGVVLLPLHPVYRMGGLAPGRSWSVWLLDPIGSMAPGTGPQLTLVNATVLPDLQPLQNGSRLTDCQVIEYEGKDISGRTWVDRQGLVVRVLFRLGNEEWEISRD